MGEVVTLHPKTDAPIQPIVPRSEFGQRKPSFRALAEQFDETIPRERAEDRADQDRIKRAARAAREAYVKPHICPTLIRDLAAEINHIAEMCEAASAKAKAYGLTSTQVALREHGGLLETESARVVSTLVAD